MPTRLLTLVLCLLVLMPQQLCACHWAGCHGSSVSDHGNGDGDARLCDCAGSIDPAPAATYVPAGDAPGCPCCCHSHPGGHADCPHAASDAVVEPPKPGAAGNAADLPVPFLSFAIPSAERSALCDRSHSPPRAHPVPLYITFCSMQN